MQASVDCIGLLRIPVLADNRKHRSIAVLQLHHRCAEQYKKCQHSLDKIYYTTLRYHKEKGRLYVSEVFF